MSGMTTYSVSQIRTWESRDTPSFPLLSISKLSPSPSDHTISLLKILLIVLYYFQVKFWIHRYGLLLLPDLIFFVGGGKGRCSLHFLTFLFLSIKYGWPPYTQMPYQFFKSHHSSMASSKSRMSFATSIVCRALCRPFLEPFHIVYSISSYRLWAT